MKTIFKIKVAFFMLAVFFMACDKNKMCIEGGGAITTEILSVEDFTGVDLASALNVVINYGPVQEVKAIGHSNIISRLKTNVSGSVWNIELEKGCYQHYELTVYVTLPLLTSAAISGSGNITINDFENQIELILSIPGSGNIELYDFNGVEYLSVNIKGSGSITGNGPINGLQDLNINIGGSGNFKGFPIQTNNCLINISGSGNCEVFVENKLDIKVTGSGSIFYKGNPSITTDMNAAGSLVNSN